MAYTSASTNKLELLERELMDLKEKVRATQNLIHDEKTFIVNSKQENQDQTTQLRLDLVELNTLSRQIVVGEDKDDEAIIAEADRVRIEVVCVVQDFLR